ncbi:MAG: hypothetical protein VKK04_25110 [Synechococcales bacterium]|nr:hypothetical protein [Synechococcales bacterium]
MPQVIGWWAIATNSFPTMNITPETKQLIAAVQALKPQYPDPASSLFIDFYCQCRQGMDYLFPATVHQTVRLLDILQWFFDCIDRKEPTSLVRLMWNDVAGPTLQEYLGDEKIEASLLTAFEGDCHCYLEHWDRVQLRDGSVRLVMKELLAAISDLELTVNVNAPSPL